MNPNIFAEIMEVELRSAKLNFWEDEEEELDNSDVYAERVLLSEDDDVDPVTAGVMLGFMAA